MAWYWIVLIVLGVLLGLYLLLFVFYIANGDGKMISHIYDMLIKYHDNKKSREKI